MVRISQDDPIYSMREYSDRFDDFCFTEESPRPPDPSDCGTGNRAAWFLGEKKNRQIDRETSLPAIRHRTDVFSSCFSSSRPSPIPQIGLCSQQSSASNDTGIGLVHGVVTFPNLRAWNRNRKNEGRLWPLFQFEFLDRSPSFELRRVRLDASRQLSIQRFEGIEAVLMELQPFSVGFGNSRLTSTTLYTDMRQIF